MKKDPVFLRALEAGDLERTLRWHNDPALYETLGGPFRFVSRETEEEWLRSRCRSGDRELNLAICLARTGEHIGNIYLRNIDWISRHGEMHMSIGDRKHRSRGYGASALQQLIAHAFRTMGLQRMYLHVLEDNAAALAVYRRCGFAVEGTLRRHAFKDGAFKNVLVMGLCADATC
jgi:RimJ/RimL family protein N-acetyltransferase